MSPTHASRSGREAGDERPSGPVKPRSVRDLVGPPLVPDPPPQVETPPEVPAPETRTLEVEGRLWEARVVGTAEASRGSRSAPLLLVRFAPRTDRRPGPEEGVPETGPERVNEGAALEGWVAGRSLDDVPADRLSEALARGRPWSEEPPDRPFFDEYGGRRRR